MTRLIAAVALLALMSGCAAVSDYIGLDDVTIERAAAKKPDDAESAINLAKKGMDDYRVGRYFNAVDYFEKILNRYPFSPEATLAELKAADCKFFMERYGEALGQYRDFEEHHPTNEAMPYVLFQKGMCHYLRIDRVDRDTSYAAEAVKQFKQLLRQFPDSPYASEAEARVRAAQDFLANHEFFVAEYYLRQGKPQEAQGRFNYLLTLYPDSTLAPKAKELLAQIKAGKTPEKDFTSYLPTIALPDWMSFQKKRVAPPQSKSQERP
ncbi:MAG: outer membrane protein assembly factor BamD [Desulfobulbaceae bacterium]|jgi:outer membrane protein assembly factor BamD|nr:outer membrane protein assembly factor BamD [Desulfobulbaceae bacterium]